MATWKDVSRLALALPEAEEGTTYGGNRAWTVRRKMFVWERPLRKRDLAALGDSAPEGPILGAKTEHLVAKEALLAEEQDAVFTIPHFDGYAAVLVRLPEADLPPRGGRHGGVACLRSKTARARLHGGAVIEPLFDTPASATATRGSARRSSRTSNRWRAPRSCSAG